MEPFFPDLSQPSSEIVAALPICQIMNKDDAVHSVEEDMSCVPLTVAASHVPQLDKERLLLLGSLHELVQLHLERFNPNLKPGNN